MRTTGKVDSSNWKTNDLSKQVHDKGSFQKSPVKRGPRTVLRSGQIWTSLQDGIKLLVVLKNLEKNSQKTLPVKNCNNIAATCFFNLEKQALYQKIQKIPVFKAGDPCCFNNYRPISILPCFYIYISYVKGFFLIQIF